MVTLKNGDILTVTCEFQHKGEAFSGAKVYATVGKADTLIERFEELQGYNGTTTITGIKNDEDWTTYQVTVDVSIQNIGGFLGPKPGSIYEIYVKLIGIPGPDIFWYGPHDDINLETGEAAFQNLSVSYAKA